VYDPQGYDFGGIIARLYAEHVPAAATPSEALAQLHESAAGQSELGSLGCASTWAAEGLEYSKELDEATRYGCGVFNRLWKSSPLRDEFLALYERFVREVIAPQLGSADLIYQAVPVFRVFLPRHLAVGPRHTDAGYHVQPNELNFWLPLTEVYGSNSLNVESAAGRGDFEPIACGPGTMFRFRGNACEHFTSLNVSGITRVSFDFRVIRSQELPLQPVGAAEAEPGGATPTGAAAYFQIGRYYRRLSRGL